MEKQILEIIFINLVILLVGIFAFLTKKGVIPNYLGIEFLCSSKETKTKINSSIDTHLNDQNDTTINPAKPVIYLYPQKVETVKVKLKYNGKLVATYPNYNDEIQGWEVIAHPDGKLINSENDYIFSNNSKKSTQSITNREYSYLFWEGISNIIPKYDFSKGFVVKGENTKEFLQYKLSEIGLTPKEYNEFIVYWYPLMMNNKYNWIYFAGEEYTNNAKLTITPNPDSILRVFMVFKSLENPIEVKEQEFNKFERKGFSVIEWGGAQLK